MNTFVLVGRLVKDPELREGEKEGKRWSKASFSIAEGYNDNTQFFDCSAWNNNADYISKYFKKGDLVSVQGNVHINVVDKDGSKTKYFDFEVTTIDKLLNAGTKEEKA